MSFLQKIFKTKNKRNQTINTPEPPIELTNLVLQNPFIKNITLLNLRPFYDSEWLIETTSSSITITRDETAKLSDVCTLLSKVNSIEEIKAFDLKDRIYYD